MGIKSHWRPKQGALIIPCGTLGLSPPLNSAEGRRGRAGEGFPSQGQELCKPGLAHSLILELLPQEEEDEG